MDSTIYVDMPFVAEAKGEQAHRVGARNGHQWCHMWSEDLDALHAMAKKIGMKREWFQPHRHLPHYDLVPSKRAHAIRLGAKEKPIIEAMRELRNVTAKST